MTVPTAITDLSTTASSNDPQGSESVFPNLDNYMRAAYKFIADIYQGAVSLVQLDVTGAATFNGATEVTKSGAATNLDVTADSTYAANLRLAGNATTAGTTSLDLYQGTSSVGYLYNRANAALYFGTNNSARACFDASGHFLPYSGVSFDLGSASKYWRNVYTQGLNMSTPSGASTVASISAPSGYFSNLDMVGNGGTAGVNGTTIRAEIDGSFWIGTREAYAVNLATDDTIRVVVSGAGNVTINEPVSGIALTVTGDLSTETATVTSANEAGENLLTTYNENASLTQFFVAHVGAVTNIGNYRNDGNGGLNLYAGRSPRIEITADGNVTVQPADSGYALTFPTKTPASASDTGTAGNFSWDGSYLYVCTATNTWKRAALSTW